MEITKLKGVKERKAGILIYECGLFKIKRVRSVELRVCFDGVHRQPLV